MPLAPPCKPAQAGPEASLLSAGGQEPGQATSGGAVVTPLKVCFISPLGYGLYRPDSRLPFGGAEVQFFLLAKALSADENFHVTVLTTVAGAPATERQGRLTLIARQGKNRLQGHPGKWFGAWVAMWRQLRVIDADVYLHAGAGVEVGAYALICRLLRRRFIYVVASQADLCEVPGQDGMVQGPLRRLFPLGLRLAHAVVCRTEEQRTWLRGSYGREGVLIRTGHPTPEQSSNGQVERPRPFILWAGRAKQLKQPERFLDLAAGLPQERFVMALMTDPSQEDFTETLRGKAAALPNVTVHEDVPWEDMNRLFAQAKLFVNTSVYEGFPNTFVQAAMQGVPILSLTVDPDGVLGRERIGICASGSLERLVEAAKQLCVSDSAWAACSARAKAYARDYHGVNRSVRDLKHLLLADDAVTKQQGQGPGTKALRLCFVGPADSITLRRWVEWFAARGHETTVVTVEPPDPNLARRFKLIDVSLAWLPNKLGRLLSAVRLAFLLRRLKLDVVHLHYVRGLAWGLLLAGRVPSVATPWGSDLLEEQGAFKEWYSRSATLALLKRVSLVTAHSRYMEGRIRPLLPDTTSVMRIGWGVDLRLFRGGLDAGAIRQRWGIDKSRRVVFSPRLAKAFYNHDLIVKALPALRRKVPEVLVVVSEQFADQGYVAGLRRLAVELGVADHVLFVGAIAYQDMPLWLNLAEAVVMVPQSDGMPNTLLETMACGAVPVLSRLPQYAELVSHGVNGFLVEPHPDDLAEMLCHLLSDAGIRERMAGYNRAVVEELADQDKEMARMERCYRQLAEGSRGGRPMGQIAAQAAQDATGLSAAGSLPRQPVKVMLLTVGLGIGGTEGHLFDLATRLDRKRFAVVVCALKGEGEIARELRRSGVKVVTLGGRGVWDLRVLSRLAATMKAERPDVVHAFLFWANIASRVVGRLLRVPVLISSYRELAEARSWGRRTADRLTIHWAQAVTCCSDAVRRVVCKTVGGDERKYLTIHNGVAIDRFEAQRRASAGPTKSDLGLKEAWPVIGTVCRLDEPTKG
ncbi:MAG: glycosyltransferase, partial [Nitrospira sp.]|nr:glycosyltransferase [Nitrospira sp.]